MLPEAFFLAVAIRKPLFTQSENPRTKSSPIPKLK
jgi:hypothetical protein